MKDGKRGKWNKSKSKRKSISLEEKARVSPEVRSLMCGPNEMFANHRYHRLTLPSGSTWKSRQTHFKEEKREEERRFVLEEQKVEDIARKLSQSYIYQGKMTLGGTKYFQFDRRVSWEPTGRKLWHGTHYMSLDPILKGRLNLGHPWGLFGSAIYLGELDKAQLHNPYCLFCVEVKLGRVYVAPKALHGCPKGYDTVRGKREYTATMGGETLKHDEWAVYDPSRVNILSLYLLDRTSWEYSY